MKEPPIVAGPMVDLSGSRCARNIS